VTLRIAMLDPDLPEPTRAHDHDAGWDLSARESVTLAPGERRLVPTGVAAAIPDGYVGLLCPRSGLALRAGLGIVNSPGIIDAGYRGEIAAVLINHDRFTPVNIARGERIAQLVVVPIFTGSVEVVTDNDELGTSERGTRGFGSTGT
jgi:dUTP pyrophosphatase